MAQHGQARLGEARNPRHSEVWRGGVRQGQARQGSAWSPLAWRGTRAARHHRRPLFFLTKFN
jgi:hypothetical protein